MQMQSERLQEYIDRMSRDLVRDYSIPAEMYENQDIKRGLRNNDGTGVLVGISKVGSVQGYYMVDGQRVPMPGKLYYRGISVEDIVDAHQQAGTFGYEEVAYLLLLGRLPAAEELAQFNQILERAADAGGLHRGHDFKSAEPQHYEPAGAERPGPLFL